jgi:ADP-ribose pyrophosphatase YjhB (NUDIX family)
LPSDNESQKPQQEPQNETLNPSRPIVGVGAVVFQGDKVLLIRRGKPPKENEWSLPGGKQELGERTLETMVREVREETGLSVKPGPLLGVVDFIEISESLVEYHYTLIDYLAEAQDGNPVAGTDAKDARFFTLEDALNLDLWDETKRMILLGARKKGLTLPKEMP